MKEKRCKCRIIVMINIYAFLSSHNRYLVVIVGERVRENISESPLTSTAYFIILFFSLFFVVHLFFRVTTIKSKEESALPLVLIWRLRFSHFVASTQFSYQYFHSNLSNVLSSRLYEFKREIDGVE